MSERELLRFTTTPDEIGEMMMHLGRQIYGARKQKRSFVRSFLVWICVGFVATLVIADFKRQVSPDLAEWVPGLLMFALGAICAFLGTLMWLSHFQRTRLLNHLRHSKASMDIAILQQDGGLLWRSADQMHFVRWDLFDEISTLGDGMFLRAGLIGFPLPFRAFATPSEREDFKSVLREHLPQGLAGHELLQPMPA